MGGDTHGTSAIPKSFCTPYSRCLGSHPYTYLWLDSVVSGSLGLCPVSPGWGPERRSSRTVVWSSDPPCARAARLDLDKEPRDIAIMSIQYTHEQEAMHLIVQYTNTCQSIDYTPYPASPLTKYFQKYVIKTWLYLTYPHLFIQFH